MVHLLPALVATVLGLSTAHADPEEAAPFSTKSYGDGGGYKHPDAAVGQFFETKPQSPAGVKPEHPRIPAKVTPEIQPLAAVASRPRPRPFAPVRAQPPAPMPGAAAEGGSLDSASEDARRDYESRLFGIEPASRRPGLADSGARPVADPGPQSAAGDGMLFVSLELDPREAGTLRDAVAGLGAAAAFRPDARFQPMPGLGGSVRISGWIPSSRLGDAVARPGVKRVSVERGSRPAADNHLLGDYVVTLRVTDAAHSEESIAASVRELTAETGFKLDRVLAVETLPGGGATSLVSGTMPIAQLSRALGLRGVIQVSPAIAPSIPDAQADSSTAGKPPIKRGGFVKFIMERGLWLVLVTVLIALPSVGALLKKGLSVFVPYR